ncbi:MAG: hypothetical protein JXB35_09210 [Anaerolineae bacterium]|nr:hypothetical protein [Anaerolineae bacterium]
MTRIFIAGQIGIAILVTLILLGPIPPHIRWLLGVPVFFGGEVAMFRVAFAAPRREAGLMERRPEGGGVLRREQWWLLQRHRIPWEFSLEDVSGFVLERKTFAESGDVGRQYARLWALVRDAGEPARAQITGWLEVAEVIALGEALAHASRLSFDQGS